MSKSDSPVEDVKFFQESGKVLFTGPRNPKDFFRAIWALEIMLRTFNKCLGTL